MDRLERTVNYLISKLFESGEKKIEKTLGNGSFEKNGKEIKYVFSMKVERID